VSGLLIASWQALHSFAAKMRLAKAENAAAGWQINSHLLGIRVHFRNDHMSQEETEKLMVELKLG
jgi:hypothetical protein